MIRESCNYANFFSFVQTFSLKKLVTANSTVPQHLLLRCIVKVNNCIVLEIICKIYMNY